MYNNLEKQFYHLKDDCVFDTNCLLVPNNFSFMNFKRPDTNGHFYSQNVKNNKQVIPLNCNCVRCIKANNNTLKLSLKK